MKAALVVLALSLLSACAPTLRQHALVALASSTLIDEVGRAIEEEAYADWREVGGEHAAPDEIAVLAAMYGPLRADYDQVRDAHAAYVRAIAKANERGDKALVQQPARTLLQLWVRLEDIGERLGVRVPPAPDALHKLVGGTP